jgi:hypothetical protein
VTGQPAGRSLKETIVAARLQVLQSKRLMLASSQRRFENSRAEPLHRRAERLRGELDHAQELYRHAILRWGSPAFPDFWPVAYGELIHLGDDLARKLRHATIGCDDTSQRFEIATEVEVIEDLIHQWRESLRGQMQTAIA